MITHRLLKLATTGAVLALGMGSYGPAGLGGAATAADRSPEDRIAAAAFRNAEKALKRNAVATAIGEAELAVANAPERADYRFVLGQAYMKGGRFLSAATTFEDVIALDEANGKAALNLALMQVALGRNADALATLDTHREKIGAADFGLAVALAGDVEAAVRILQTAARAEDADAKTRQNLALAFAMSGRWVHARIMAARDVPYDMLNDRMAEWAQFARPAQPSDQIASLMGIIPVEDPGQPARLARNGAPRPSLALALPEPEPETPASLPAADPEAPRFEVPVATGQRVSIALDAPNPAEPDSRFLPVSAMQGVAAAPVMQAEAPLIRSTSGPFKQAVEPASAAPSPARAIAPPVRENAMRASETGRFVVQLGAFSSAARAETAWDRATARIGILAGRSASTARVTVNGNQLYRLSVSGFASRDAATQVCVRVQSAGGSCFVRSIAGDTPVKWAGRGGTRIAARR